MTEKIIAKIENKNPYEIKTKKEPEIMLEIDKNYMICRGLYQALFYEIAETFIQYVDALATDEIEQLDADLKANGWGVKSIVKIEDCIKLLKMFQLFFYLNGRLPLTNGYLLIPDGEMPDSSKKISLTNLFKMLKGTEYHGLVSVQFLSALNFFFGGDVQLSKDTITELYENLSLETLSGERQAKFDKISELTSNIDFKMKHSILTNNDDQGNVVKTSNGNIKDTYEFFKKPSDEDDFEREIVEDILKHGPYEHKK